MTKQEIVNKIKEGYYIKNNGYYNNGKPINNFELCSPDQKRGASLKVNVVLYLINKGVIKNNNGILN